MRLRIILPNKYFLQNVLLFATFLGLSFSVLNAQRQKLDRQLSGPSKPNDLNTCTSCVGKTGIHTIAYSTSISGCTMEFQLVEPWDSRSFTREVLTGMRSQCVVQWRELTFDFSQSTRPVLSVQIDNVNAIIQRVSGNSCTVSVPTQFISGFSSIKVLFDNCGRGDTLPDSKGVTANCGGLCIVANVPIEIGPGGYFSGSLKASASSPSNIVSRSLAAGISAPVFGPFYWETFLSYGINPTPHAFSQELPAIYQEELDTQLKDLSSSTTMLTTGPSLHIGEGRFSTELFLRAGLALVKPRQNEVSLIDSSGVSIPVIEFEENSGGLVYNVGARLNFALTKRFKVYAKTEYQNSFAPFANYKERDVNAALDMNSVLNYSALGMQGYTDRKASVRCFIVGIGISIKL